MTFWNIFAACFAVQFIWAIIGFSFAALLDKWDKEDKKEQNITPVANVTYCEEPTPELTHEDRMIMLSDIVEVFENLLDEKGITIENDEKKEDPHASNIYGTDYGNVTDEIEKILVGYGLLEKEC